MASTHHGGDTRPRGFGDTIWARLIALAIAAGLGWLLWSSWSEELTGIVDRGPAELPIAAQPLPDAGVVNEALQACLDKRLGDVETMASEGVISEAQKTAFSQRAADLCRAQNPG